MNKTLVTTIVVVILIFVGYLLFAPKTTRQPEVPAVGEQTVPSEGGVSSGREVTVGYTEDGFSPNPITINKGDSILFMNLGSGQMWPASAVHPSHAEYPTTGGCIGSTFDACRDIGPGNGWSFQFDIPGTWRYHNHVNTAHTGVVIVNE